MKKSFPTLIFLASLVALGLAGWDNFHLRQKVAELRGEVAQLEHERRFRFSRERPQIRGIEFKTNGSIRHFYRPEPILPLTEVLDTAAAK